MKSKHINHIEVTQKGKNIYETMLKDKLEEEYKGYIAAIEVETGDYFLGKRGIEAIKKARLKYPKTIFYMVKIGFPVVHQYRFNRKYI